MEPVCDNALFHSAGSGIPRVSRLPERRYPNTPFIISA